MKGTDGVSPIDQIFEVLESANAKRYGKAGKVNQLEHALQCATNAEEAGASPALITASLLHDIGHLYHKDWVAAVERKKDDLHEVLGEKMLSKWFGEAVVKPIRLHVDAKRYLTAREPDYHAHLSPGSVRSLELQGGPFSADEAAAFESEPHFEDSINLRRWDEQAKTPGRETPGLAHFRQYVEQSLKPDTAA
ncbi:MAG: HD domain-containing protein [Alphaproteobacteria bacterium]|nr:HD domain-containing protein [Alphaproteobacteria bacterium]